MGDIIIEEINISDDEKKHLNERLNDLKNKLSQEYNIGYLARAKVDVTELLPRYLVNIKHKGKLKILAFSDYRTQSLEEITKFVNEMEEKPDVIVYAGDDLDRFAPMPADFISISTRSSLDTISCVTVQNVEGMSSASSCKYGFILRLPKHLGKNYLIELFKSALIIVCEICKKFCDGCIHGIHDVKEIVEDLRKHLQTNIIFSDEQIGSRVSSIDVIDSTTGILIVHIKFDKRYNSISFDGPLYHYLTGLNVYRPEDIESAQVIEPIPKIHERDYYEYYYLPSASKNHFEELAKHSKYGVLVVKGNDDSKVGRALIYGDKVYDLHKTIVRIGSFVFVGFEGPYFLYEEVLLEGYIKIRFEFVKKFIGTKDKIVIVSHIPPENYLDRTARSMRSVGSPALRQIMEKDRRLKLIICGHVHACGGRYTTFDDTIIANVSSHDSVLNRANVALIILQEDTKPQIVFEEIPSLIEQEFKRDNLELVLCTNYYSTQDIKSFRNYIQKYYPKIFDDLKYLADIKHKYGLPWSVVFEMYDKHGISRSDQLSDDIFQNLISNSRGIYRPHIKRAYAKFKRERSQGTYLLNPLPLKSDKIILFDVEYDYDWVLFGFLDLNSDQLKQFWKTPNKRDLRDLKEYACSKADYTFVHWGGRDKSFLKEICPSASTFNILYFTQTNLVTPLLNSNELKDVHDALCGHAEDEWWDKYFYNVDGFDKVVLCNRIINGEENLKDILAEANKADLFALKKVFKKLKELPVKKP